jgi:DNA-directed RNA polymerase subunit H (RpoH/RPB5)
MVTEVIQMKTHENLVEELARLSPEELKSVLDNLGKRLEKDKQLNMAEKIVKEYKPALEELAK